MAKRKSHPGQPIHAQVAKAAQINSKEVNAKISTLTKKLQELYEESKKVKIKRPPTKWLLTTYILSNVVTFTIMPRCVEYLLSLEIPSLIKEMLPGLLVPVWPENIVNMFALPLIGYYRLKKLSTTKTPFADATDWINVDWLDKQIEETDKKIEQEKKALRTAETAAAIANLALTGLQWLFTESDGVYMTSGAAIKTALLYHYELHAVIKEKSFPYLAENEQILQEKRVKEFFGEFFPERGAFELTSLVPSSELSQSIFSLKLQPAKISKLKQYRAKDVLTELKNILLSQGARILCDDINSIFFQPGEVFQSGLKEESRHLLEKRLETRQYNKDYCGYLTRAMQQLFDKDTEKGLMAETEYFEENNLPAIQVHFKLPLQEPAEISAMLAQIENLGNYQFTLKENTIIISIKPTSLGQAFPEFKQSELALAPALQFETPHLPQAPVAIPGSQSSKRRWLISSLTQLFKVAPKTPEETAKQKLNEIQKAIKNASPEGQLYPFYLNHLDDNKAFILFTQKAQDALALYTTQEDLRRFLSIAEVGRIVPQKGSKGIVSCSYTKDHPYKLKDPTSDIRIYLRREVYQDPITKEQTLIYITDRIDTKHKRHGLSYEVGQDEAAAAAAPC